MKRMIALILVTVLTLATIAALAEDGTLNQWTNTDQYNQQPAVTLRVVRPTIKMTEGKGAGRLIRELSFGQRLTLLQQDGEYCYVRDDYGWTGYVATAYIVNAMHYLWIGEGGVYLSPKPDMNVWDFGYGSGGYRINEEAVVIYETGYYYYIVTSHGFSGFVHRLDPNIAYFVSK